VKSLVKGFTQYLLLVALLIGLLVATGHCEPTSISSEALGINMLYSNPNVYILASVSKGNVIQDDQGQFFTNIIFQPYNTYSLFTESVLFCGDVSDDFNKKGALIVTYERVAHHRNKRVGCHELRSVFQVKSK
jgi:hypothetical protein